MDGRNGRQARSKALTAGSTSTDWKTHFPPGARQRIIDKLMETMKRCLGISVPEELNELKRSAVQLEDKFYSDATNQSDYLRSISSEMFCMETGAKLSSSIDQQMPKPGGEDQNPAYPGSLAAQSLDSPGQPLAVLNRQSLLPQNFENNTSAGPAFPSISGLSHSMFGFTRGSNIQNMPGILQSSVNNSAGQIVQADIFAGAQRLMQERQQKQILSQPPPQQIQQLYQRQLQQQMLSEKLQQSSLMQPHTQQQQQWSPTGHLLSTLQHKESNVQQTQAANTQLASQSGIQQNQLNQIQQSASTCLQQIPQYVGRQQKAQQTPLQQQQQPPQLGSQSNMVGMRQEYCGSLPSVSTMQPHQRSLIMQKNVIQQHQLQQQAQLTSLTLSQSQGHGLQFQHQSSNWQLMAQFQSQPTLLQREMLMQLQSNSLPWEMQQGLVSGNLLQSQNPLQQKQFIQQQRGLPEMSYTMSMDSAAQTGHAGLIDVQEECYEKIKSMKELYFRDLSEFHQKIARKVQQQEQLSPPGKQSEQYRKLEGFKQMMEKMLQFLQIPKSSIPHNMKDKLVVYEKQMQGMIAASAYRTKKIPPMQQQQQFQHANVGNLQPMPQQQQSSQVAQVAQMKLPDNHQNSVQQINLPGTSLQSGGASILQHMSTPLPTKQQNLSNTTQASSNMVTVQVSSSNSAQPGAIEFGDEGGIVSVQNSLCTSQQNYSNTLSQSTVNTLQANVCSMQPGSDVLLQQQQMIQEQQQFQLRQMQQQIFQHQPKQLKQLHSMNDLNDGKGSEGSGVKTMLHDFPAGQCPNYCNQLLKQGADVPATAREYAAEHPLERLIRVVQNSAPEVCTSFVEDTGPVVSMFDRLAGSAPGNGSRTAVSEDLVEMTKHRLQAKKFMSQDGGATAKKMKRHISARPLNNVSSAGSGNDSFQQSHGFESSELESTATSRVKRLKPEAVDEWGAVDVLINNAGITLDPSEMGMMKSQWQDVINRNSQAAAKVMREEKVNRTVLEEIAEINQKLIDMVVKVTMMLIHLLLLHLRVGKFPIMPLRILVPASYPKCSPAFLDKLPVEPSREIEDPSSKAKPKLGVTLPG